MDLAAAVKRVKRNTGLGVLSRTTDQVTQDIVNAINDRSYTFWNFHDWEYSLNPIEITMVTNQSDYTLTVDDGDILVLYPEKQGRPLRRYTFKEWLTYQRRATEDGNDAGNVFGYQSLGRNSADQRKVRMLRTPNSTNSGQKILGFSKKRLTVYTVADIATNTALNYFPREVHPIIVLGAEADINTVQKKPEAAKSKNKDFFGRLQLLVTQETSEPDDSMTTRPPAIYVRRKRRRSGTNVT